MKKGSFGYLRRKRRASAVKSVLFLAAVLLVYFAALRHFHTNRNVFSILAAVGALPTGRSIVETVMYFRARGASEAVREAVSALACLPSESAGFDLCLTSYERAFSVSHLTVGGGQVLGLTEDPGTDCGLCRTHIEKMLEQDHREGYRVRIYRDLQAYTGAVKSLCAEPWPDPQGDRETFSMLRAVSL